MAAIIYLSAHRGRHAKIYSLHILAIIFWVFAMVLYRSSSAENAMFFAICLYVTPTFIASIFYLFTCIFPFEDKKFFKTQALVVFGLNLAIVIATSIPGFIIKEVKVVPGQEKQLFFSSWYILYFAYTFLIFSFAYIKLLWKYFKTEKRAKSQTLYIIIGHFLSSNLAFVTNLTLPWMGVYIFNWAGQVFTCIMLIMTTYAIITHRLMDIKLVIKQWGVLFSSLFIMLISVISVEVALTKIWPAIATWSDILVITLAVLAYPFVEKFVSWVANRYFSYSLYDIKKVVPEINKKLISSLDQKEIYSFVFKTFNNILHFNNFCILKKQKNETYSVVYNHGFKIKVGDNGHIDEKLELEHASTGEILDDDQLKNHHLNFSSKGKKFNLLEKNVEIFLPLSTKNGLIGFILFGPKESGDMYSDGDLKLFYIVGSQIASAMENVELYAEIKSLNQGLEKKVLEQTKELKSKALELEAKNQNLEKLLQIKNEFLRIINHQINTPLSIIKNSIFMVKNKSFSVEKGLSFIDEGVRRMEGVFNDFWRAFSFEGEGIKMKFAKIDIYKTTEKIVADALAMESVKAKKLIIKLEKKSVLPPVKSDLTQISQVVSNLLENAITYTPKGVVKIKMEKVSNFVKISVSDTGQGIDKKDVKNLFEKFYRTDRAKKYRPGGSGLGLYIAKKIIEANGGILKLEKSTVDKGSTFSFTLPIWKTGR